MLRAGLFFTGKPEVIHDGSFTVAIPAPAAGRYDVAVHYVRGEAFGIVRLSVNGEAVGQPADTYLRTLGLTRPIWPPTVEYYRGVALDSGDNRFSFAVDAKNPDSPGYRMAIDCVVLTSAD